MPNTEKKKIYHSDVKIYGNRRRLVIATVDDILLRGLEGVDDLDFCAVDVMGNDEIEYRVIATVLVYSFPSTGDEPKNIKITTYIPSLSTEHVIMAAHALLDKAMSTTPKRGTYEID